MGGMTDPVTPPPTPGERRLAHPPSDRYRAGEATAAEVVGPPRPVSPGRGLAYAAIVAVVGAVAITVMGGVLTLTGGLLVTAAVIGVATGWALRAGAGASLTPGRRSVIALVLALVAVVAGQLGLWLYAGSEGGVLPLVDYLGETFGLLVPLQIVIAPAVAWMAAR